MIEMQSAVPALSLGFTLLSSLAAAVWFLANLREKLTAAFASADHKTREDVLSEFRRESERMENAFGARLGSLSSQMSALSAEFRDHQRTAATKSELDTTEDRINRVLERMEEKVDTLNERTASIVHLAETVRALNASVDSLRTVVMQRSLQGYPPAE